MTVSVDDVGIVVEVEVLAKDAVDVDIIWLPAKLDRSIVPLGPEGNAVVMASSNKLLTSSAVANDSGSCPS